LVSHAPDRFEVNGEVFPENRALAYYKEKPVFSSAEKHFVASVLRYCGGAAAPPTKSGQSTAIFPV